MSDARIGSKANTDRLGEEDELPDAHGQTQLCASKNHVGGMDPRDPQRVFFMFPGYEFHGSLFVYIRSVSGALSASLVGDKGTEKGGEQRQKGRQREPTGDKRETRVDEGEQKGDKGRPPLSRN